MGATQSDFWRRLFAAAAIAFAAPSAAFASDFSEPWKRDDRALVIDAYEYNSIDWAELASDKRIVGFINKASDGLPPPYACKGDETEVRLCRALFRRHAVAKELFQTRRTVARALGLEWGAYHLARPGNPIEQANNFIDFARPGPDDLMALDIEDNNPEKWMSLADAEEFVRHVHRRVGRFPVLYTNGSTAQHIADHRHLYPLLSRLPLWYARYKPEIDMHFPKGNWQSYALWQFATQANCNARRCPYRVPGTPTDIDVNVAAMTAEELRTAWPFGGLVGVPVDMLFRVPVPVARADALEGEVTIAYADVARLPTFSMLAEAAGEGWRRMRYGWAVAMSGPYKGRYRHGMAEYAAGKLEAFQQMVADAESAAGIDPIATGSIPAADSAKD